MPRVSRQSSRNSSDDDSVASASSSRSYIRSSGIAPFPDYAYYRAPHLKQETDSSDFDEIPKAGASGRSTPASLMGAKASHSPGHSKKLNMDPLTSSDELQNHKYLSEKSNSHSRRDLSSRVESRSHKNLQSQELSQKHGSNSTRSLRARKPPQYPEPDYSPKLQHTTGDAGLDQQSQQDLEIYAVAKSKETTATIYHALKIAESTKEVATKTTLQVHQQGEQIRKTHETAVIVDMELKRGEKLLNSLGGLFSKKWKPKKNHAIRGPTIDEGKQFKSKAYALEQRAALGLKPPTDFKSKRGPTSSVDDLPLNSRLEAEKAKQDDALSDLSNVVDQLKEMSLDLAHEFDRQSEGIVHLHEDVSELHFRIKGDNERGRKLLYG